MEQTRIRPTGVTIIAILNIIAGLIMFGWGFAFSAFSTFLAFIPFIGPIAAAVSAVTVGIGLAYLALAWGALKGKPWAWTLELVISVIAVITSLLSFDIIVLAIGAVILYYLHKPHVKAYFGKQAQTL